MKRYILTAILISFLGTAGFAQTAAQQELKAYMSDGLVKWESADKKASFRVGGRIVLDGAHYIDDYTDRSSGAHFSDIRLRVFSTIGRKADFKLDVDLNPSRVSLKDVYFRYHTNTNGFLRVGNFAEPFSAENIQSSFDDRFIGKSATIEALGTGRALGISYRYYHPYFWGEAGVFSQKYNTLTTNGDMGYGLSTRLLGRYTCDDFSIHVGGSLNWRRPNANGFASGSDDYNRFVKPVSALESGIDETEFLGGTLNNVKNTFKYGIEVMGTYKFFYLTGEYIHATNKRERDWQTMFNSYQGTLIATMAPNMAALKALFGGDPDVNFSGYSIQAGFLILGGDYRYNQVDALMDRPRGKSLELVLRYNHTDLDDIEKNSVWNNGSFYSSWTMMAFGIPNASWSGGKVNTYTVGLNYYFSDHIALKVHYGYSDLDRRYNMAYMWDKNLHTIQARLAFEF